MRSSIKSLLIMWDLAHTYLTPLQFNPIQFNLGCHKLTGSKKALTLGWLLFLYTFCVRKLFFLNKLLFIKKEALTKFAL